MEDIEIARSVLWAVFGLALIVIELTTNTFFVLFFGISALIVALLNFVFLDHLATEMTIFSILGISSIFLFKNKVMSAFQTNDSHQAKKEFFRLDKDLLGKSEIKAEYQGADWTVINETDVDLKQGETVEVVRIDGIKLYVKLREDETIR